MKHIQTAEYHLSPNGQVEQYIETVNHDLASGSKESKTFQERLLDFSTSHRSTLHKATTRIASECLLAKL